MKNNLTLIATFLLSTIGMFGQELSIDAEIRPRTEYLHGFQDPTAKDAEPSFFTTQRTALKATFKDENFSSYISLQDVSTWGDRPQLATTDGSSFRIQEGWARLGFGDGWAVKLGRQPLSYDDQRILGALGWAQQARTHDAALLQYGKDGFALDAGFSFNQNGPSNFNTSYTPSGPGVPVFQYKTLQFLRLHKKWETFSGSFLFLNNGFQDAALPIDPANPDSGNDPTPGVSQRQTTGVHLKYKEGAFGLSVNGYYQFGEFSKTLDIAGYLGAIDMTYKTGSTLLGLGFETISGDDKTTTDKTEAFFPLFGTNHKFNGFMDYFYVGRHANNVGLNDFNAKAVFKTGEKSKLLTKIHYFTAAEQLNDLDTNLATEIDLVFTQKIKPYITLNIGYSHAFVGDGLNQLPNRRGPGTGGALTPGAEGDTNNWGWAMLTIKPNLIKWKKTATP